MSETDEKGNVTEATSSTKELSVLVPMIPTGISAPKPLLMEGNMATNWKKFRRGWENYAVISRLDQFDERFKTALFLSVIGEGAMEVFEGMHFAVSEDKHKLDTVIKQFEVTFIGETNETYERFVFNSRDQKEEETIEQYIIALRTLGQSCNFCTCLQETLFRDRVVLGVKDNSVRRKLLQERKLTLAKALDICRSSETTSKQLRDMTGVTEKSVDHEIRALRQSQRNRRRDPPKPRERRRCKYCGEIHEFDKNSCPAYGKSCNNCGLRNHFAKVCQKKRSESTRSVKGVNKEDSSDSGDPIYTVSISPEFSSDQTVLAVQTNHEKLKSRILAVMSIKGGKETSFQVDIGNIKQSELSGTKYMGKLEKTRQVFKLYKIYIGQCVVQLLNSETQKK